MQMLRMLLCLGLLGLAGCASGYREKDGKITYTYLSETGWIYQTLEAEADLATFEVLEPDRYGRDKQHVFLESSLLEGADPKTFRFLGGHYSRDDDQVFYEDDALQDVDVATFRVVDKYAGRDDTRYFLGSRGIVPEDIETFREVGDCWAKDAKAYYYQFPEIRKLDCDYATFQVLNWYYGKDATTVFYKGQPIEGADAASFEVTDLFAATDKNRSYDFGEPE